MTERVNQHCSITAKQWDNVAVWSWDVRVETCAICKGTIADLCIECRGKMELGRSAGDNSKHNNNNNNNNNNNSGGRAGGPSTAQVSYIAEHRQQQQQQQHYGVSNNLSSGVGNSNNNSNSGGVTGDCLLVWGVCNHVFHSHCVSRWVRQRPVCPICRREWEVYKTTRND
ncbi:zinc finger protein [Trypanosoma melophagium]|uniref:zinc finger protein n=1 Tax=Trypanosoma melophagium TaxID=715481 RepID=UPI00351A2F4B|nr:zinc finger protein [Trypanosoma melophagium]